MRVLPMRSGAAQQSAVQAKQAEFAITDANDYVSGYLGHHAYKGRAKPNLRILFTGMAFPVGVMVRNDSGINSMNDLKGKRIPSAWTAFPNGVPLLEGAMATWGLSWKDFKGIPTSGLIQAANAFKAGKVDATMFAVGAPKVAEVNAAVGGLKFLPIDTSPDAIARMRAVRRDYYPFTVNPSKPMVGIIKPTPLLTFDVVVLAGTHVSDADVYKFAKAIHDNKAVLAKGHPGFRRFNPAGMAKQFSDGKYHSGAIKYYKEIGIWKGN